MSDATGVYTRAELGEETFAEAETAKRLGWEPDVGDAVWLRFSFNECFVRAVVYAISHRADGNRYTVLFDGRRAERESVRLWELLPRLEPPEVTPTILRARKAREAREALQMALDAALRESVE